MIKIKHELPEKIILEQEGKQVEVPNPLKGHLIVKLPTYKERIELIKSIKYKLDGDGKIAYNEETLISSADLLDKASAFIDKVEVVNDLGFKFTSVDDLSCDPDGIKLLTQISNLLMKGIKLSPKLVVT